MKKCYRNNVLPEGAVSSENADKFGCPACEYMENNQLVTCSKFIGLSGKDPQEDTEYRDTYQCVDSWIPVLMIENSKQGMSTTVAVESARNTLNESIGTMNQNLKNTSDALMNAQVMHRLETNARELPQVPVKAVAGITVENSSDIYGA